MRISTRVWWSSGQEKVGLKPLLCACQPSKCPLWTQGNLELRNRWYESLMLPVEMYPLSSQQAATSKTLALTYNCTTSIPTSMTLKIHHLWSQLYLLEPANERSLLYEILKLPSLCLYNLIFVLANHQPQSCSSLKKGLNQKDTKDLLDLSKYRVQILSTQIYRLRTKQIQTKFL